MKHRAKTGAGMLLALVLTAPVATAHPHVYVTVETTVIYAKGTVTGVRHRWIFDEFYTSMAIEGLDTNGDGIYDRTELAELAKVNMEGLAQLDYYTVMKLGDQRLGFGAAVDVSMEHATVAAPPGPARLLEPLPTPSPATEAKPGFWSRLVTGLTGGSKTADPQGIKVLALQFTLPLKQPVLAEADGLEYSVADPQFWIWFDLDPKKGAQIGPGAPTGCTATVGLPKQDAAEIQRLGESFFSQMGGAQAGLGIAKSVTVGCPKS
jgi:ABC-type uncharacterized transport system substrate-binding protein